MKRSRVWTVDRSNLEDIVKMSKSITNVLRELGYSNPRAGRNRSDLINRLIQERIDYSHFDGTRRAPSNIEKYSLSEILIENSPYRCDHHLKKRLVKSGLLEYKCSECGLTDMWNGKPLKLHLDHKNGNHRDYRLENLRFLCPNCHSQTETYAGKNAKSVA